MIFSAYPTRLNYCIPLDDTAVQRNHTRCPRTIVATAVKDNVRLPGNSGASSGTSRAYTIWQWTRSTASATSRNHRRHRHRRQHHRRENRCRHVRTAIYINASETSRGVRLRHLAREICGADVPPKNKNDRRSAVLSRPTSGNVASVHWPRATIPPILRFRSTCVPKRKYNNNNNHVVSFNSHPSTHLPIYLPIYLPSIHVLVFSMR